MLSVYTRHTSDCPYRENADWKRCRCPKWLDGTLPGETGRYRKTAKTRSWEKAEERRRTLEFEADERRRALVDGYSAPRANRTTTPAPTR